MCVPCVCVCVRACASVFCVLCVCVCVCARARVRVCVNSENRLNAFVQSFVINPRTKCARFSMLIMNKQWALDL